MALNIKDPETEQLAAQVAALAGETKTRAVKVALRERKERLTARITTPDRAGDLWLAAGGDGLLHEGKSIASLIGGLHHE